MAGQGGVTAWAGSAHLAQLGQPHTNTTPAVLSSAIAADIAQLTVIADKETV